MADPTVTQSVRDRLAYAQASGALIGREDTQFADEIALEVKYTHPITLLTRSMKQETSRTVDVHWFEDKYLPHRDQINYGTGYNSSATGFVVDHGEYFAVGDLLRDPATDEVMLVYEQSSSSETISVVRDYGQSDEGWTAKADALADDAYLEILSNAFEAGHPLPAFRHTIDVEKKNYCQTQRTPIELTEDSEDTTLRAAQDQPFQVKKAGEEHFWKIERQNIWGKPAPGDKGAYDSTALNKNPAQAGGFAHYIDYYTDSDYKNDETDLTEWEFLDHLESAYDKGDDSKLLVCPPNLRTGFDKWGISRQNTFEKTTTLGMSISAWQTSHGKDLMILTHDMLKRYSTDHWFYAFILDMSQLSWVTFGRNGQSRYREAGSHKTHGKTLTSYEYETQGCIVIKQPNYHSRLRYKTISA